MIYEQSFIVVVQFPHQRKPRLFLGQIYAKVCRFLCIGTLLIYDSQQTILVRSARESGDCFYGSVSIFLLGPLQHFDQSLYPSADSKYTYYKISLLVQDENTGCKYIVMPIEFVVSGYATKRLHNQLRIMKPQQSTSGALP